MVNKFNKYLIIILMLIVLGATYTLVGSKLGVKISCSEGKILGCSDVPAPLLAISPPTVCSGLIEISTDSITLCKGLFKSPMDEYVYPCPELKNYRGQNITVNLTLDNNGQTLEHIVC